MEESIQLKKINPRIGASLFSRLFFLWLLKCITHSNDKNCGVEDIPKCPQSFLSKTNGSRFIAIWTEEKRMKKQSAKPSLLKVILKTYRYEIIKYGVLAFINFVLIRGSQPIVLSKVMQLFMDKNYTLSELLIYGGTTCGLFLMQSLLFHHIMCGNILLAYKVRVAVSSAVYRKILSLTQKSLRKSSPGQILNILTNDIGRIDGFVSYNFLWILPIQISVVVAIIWSQYGPAALGGVLGAVIFIVPIQGYMGRLTGYNCKLAAKKSDMRIKLMNEIYAGIEVIKMYTWEKPFEKNIHKARNEELEYLTISTHITGLMGSMRLFIERLGLCISVLCYSLLGNPVMANMVFSLMIFSNFLQFSCAVMLPTAMATGTELLVSLERLEEFLLLEEKEEMNSEAVEDRAVGDIQLVEVSASYGEDSTIDFTSMEIPQGTLCAVVGAVGSGKSSFLKLLLGELPKDQGTILRNGRISYSSQTTWIFPSTIRKNIVFDQEFDEMHYREVIRVCSLTEDLEQFPNGDKTVAGSRGVTLSGGQRVRINLARAVYRKADIYLLEDVLSALDTRVGRHVFEECIMKFLRGKTRVFVTHQLQYLKKADHIMIFDQGGLVSQGSFKTLSKGNSEFTDLFPPAKDSNDGNISNEMNLEKDGVRNGNSTSSIRVPLSTMDLEDQPNSEVKIGNHQYLVFWSYLEASDNIAKIIIFILSIFLAQIFLIGADYWITIWSDQEMMREDAKISSTAIENVTKIRNFFEPLLNYSIFSTWVDHIVVANEQHITLKISVLRLIYSVIISTAIVIILFGSALLMSICLKASQNLHTKIFSSFLGAPRQFINTTPTGYTMNIFSKDLGTVDSLLPRNLLCTFGVIPVITSSMFLIFISSYYMVVFMLPMIWMTIQIVKWYISSFLGFRRMEAKEQSLILSYVSSTIDGIDTIRATKCEATLIDQFDGYQDVHTSAAFLASSCTGAVGLWSDLIGIFFLCCTLLAFVVMDKYVYVSGSFIGLAIFQSISIVGTLKFGIKSLSEVLNHLTSVERILEYSKLDKEEPVSREDGGDLSKWPSDGRIKIQELSLSYDKNEKPVLQNLNIEILPSEKVGIAGRTGAGKSSLISALFRLAPFKGTILIDGVDTQIIKLKALREKISIIPQEPILFSGTIRYNLDPLHQFKDEEIWMALEDVELKETIKSLDFELTQEGNDLSVGQKQLLCLARTILRKNRIIVLDEATANVDERTDELIQKTMRRKFKDCTVLTIAHRLSSIIDSDRILVMDSGQLVEFDAPYFLLQNMDGKFYKLWEEAKSSFTGNNV